MRKIPGLFMLKTKSSEADTERVNPECLWVLDRAVPITVTVKRDGTAMMRKDGKWYQRRVLKVHTVAGGVSGTLPAPNGFEPAQVAPTYDQENRQLEWPGWVPLSEQYREAMVEAQMELCVDDGTYELCGPKINGNPEQLEKHTLFRHGSEVIEVSDLLVRSKEIIIQIVKLTRAEGIVIYGSGDRKAKVKRREFRFDWPICR